jgi:hypothetical protein
MQVKNPVVLLFLLFLFAILAYTFLYISGGRVDLHYPTKAAEGCTENASRQCNIGNCSGSSLCHGGAWGVCKLKLVCEPGSRVSCSEAGCVYGFRECDECGSGYGPCR